jgi:hypothetical protein
MVSLTCQEMAGQVFFFLIVAHTKHIHGINIVSKQYILFMSWKELKLKWSKLLSTKPNKLLLILLLQTLSFTCTSQKIKLQFKDLF